MTKNKPQCLNCNKHAAIYKEPFGWLPCDSCRQKQTTIPQRQVEFTTDEIKGQRKEFNSDILQPWREGRLSKEYIEQHGTRGIKATPEEIKKAKNVWDDLDYYKKD